MSLFEERDPRFVHLERKVGVFVLLGIAATVAAVLLLGIRQGVFAPRAAVFFRVASAEDLSEGAEVLTRGFRIGKVARLRLDDAGMVEVRLALDKSSLRWVKRDSTARLSKGLLVGGAKVVITPGTSGAEAVREGAELAFEPGVGLGETAQQTLEELKPVLHQLTVTIGRLGDPNGDLMTTLANLNRLTAGLEQTQRGIGATFASAGSKFDALAVDLDAAAVALRRDLLPAVAAVIEKADRTAAGAERAVQGAGAATATLEQQLPAILKSLAASLDTIQAIALDLKQASAQAPVLLQDGGTLVQDSQALVKRVGGMWLLRSNEPLPTERTLDVDSYQRRK